MRPDEFEPRFFKLLGLLATRCQTELDVLEIEIYDRVLQPHGYEQACRALEQVLIERRVKDFMPSPREIMDKIAPKQNPKNLATEAANKILAQISRRGWSWVDTYKYHHATFQAAMDSELGLLAANTVRLMGGWQRICEESGEVDTAVFRAQIRDAAASVQEEIRVNPKPQAPALSDERVKDQVKNLLGQSLPSMPGLGEDE